MPNPIPAATATSPRITFLDNLRTAMVALVVVLHVACAYSNFTTWWYVNDANAGLFDLAVGVIDIFAMPLLFFIAGYFALPSLTRQRDAGGFVTAKLRRLGLPLLVGVFLGTPIAPYIRSYFQAGRSWTTSYWDHCVNYFQNGLGLTPQISTSPDQFSQQHFWFLSLLLLFFLILAGWRAVKGPIDAAQSSSSRRASIVALALAAGLTIAGTLLIQALVLNPYNPEPWVLVGPFLQFQPTRLTLYVVYFVLGLYAWSRNWFAGAQDFGSVWLWAVVAGVLLVAHFVLGDLLMKAFSLGLGAVYVVNRCLLCLAALLFFLSAGRRYWNTPTTLSKSLAASSYHVYLVHYVVVVGVQALAFVLWPELSVYIKFAAVTAAALAVSYGVSRWLVRPYPRFFVAGLIAASALAAVLTAA